MLWKTDMITPFHFLKGTNDYSLTVYINKKLLFVLIRSCLFLVLCQLSDSKQSFFNEQQLASNSVEASFIFCCFVISLQLKIAIC